MKDIIKDNFDLRKYLAENKLTRNSRLIKKEAEGSSWDSELSSLQDALSNGMSVTEWMSAILSKYRSMAQSEPENYMFAEPSSEDVQLLKLLGFKDLIDNN